MKLHLFLLPLLLLAQNTLPNQPPKKEVKIYRKVFSVFPAFRTAWTGLVFAIGQYHLYILNLSEIISENQRGFLSKIVLPSLAIAHIYTEASRQLEWNKKKDKPILIFDEYGFTYEQLQEQSQKRKYIRCYWKDIISHWGVAGGNGESLYWKYHVKGFKEIVTINVFELEIPKEMLGQLESLRQGRIEALN